MGGRSSRVAVRVFTILTYIEGAVTIATRKADPLSKPAAEYVLEKCKIAKNSWKGAGDWDNVLTTSVLHMYDIYGKLKQIWWLEPSPEMNYPGMCYISMQLVDDLMTLINNPQRKGWLQDIFEGLTVLIDRMDPQGEMFLTQDRAQEVVNAIYSVVGER